MLVADAEVSGVATLVRVIRQSLHRAPRLPSVPLSILRAGLGLLGRSGDIDRLTEPFVVRGTQAQRVLDWRPLRNQLNELLWTVQADRAEGFHP
jgi:UDP-glucose 4-epimerase